MDLERRLKKVLKSIEEATNNLEHARDQAGDADSDISSAIDELETAKSQVRQALRECG